MRFFVIDCLRQEVLITLGGERGAVVGVECEGDGTASAVINHWFSQRTIKHTL